MSYDPKPGSVPYRALAHLATLDKGAEIVTGALADAIGYPKPGSLAMVLQDARNAGAVFCRQKGGHPKSPYFWSLVDHSKRMDAPRAGPAGDGSQKPDGDALRSSTAPARAGSSHTPQGANRDASAEQSHVAEGSASPTGRGANGATARSAAPASSSYRRPMTLAEIMEAEGGGAAPADEALPRVDAIVLHLRVATLHQAERVMQLVREMQA